MPTATACPVPAALLEAATRINVEHGLSLAVREAAPVGGSPAFTVHDYGRGDQRVEVVCGPAPSWFVESFLRGYEAGAKKVGTPW